jgi:signal transduction histidine kinase/ligand-binding sensor domain-containing protein
MRLMSALMRMSARRHARWLVCAASLGFYLDVLSAQSVTPASSELSHTAWTVRDGAPGAVRGLAQGTDGVLWIASERGLFHFDGVRFERFDPAPGQVLPPRGVHVLLPLPDTSLWIGHFGGGISVLHRGQVVTYDTLDGLPGGTVTAIARDSTGMMWASTTRGLARLEGRKWEPLGTSAGYPGGFTEPVFVDQRGSVWAGSELGLYLLPRGAKRFQKYEVHAARGRDATVHFWTIAPDGSIWGVQRPRGLFLAVDARGNQPRSATLSYADTAVFSIAFARGQPTVVTSMTGRLVRLWLPQEDSSLAAKAANQPTVVEIPFSRAAGMSGDQISTAIYDREGTLWIGTPTGVDRFRETKLTPIAWPGPVNWPTVAVDSSGTVWVAARNAAPATLFKVGQRVVPQPHTPSTLTCIYRDLRGGIWVGGEPGLWKLKAGVLVPVPLPAQPSSASGVIPQIHAIARDRADHLWVSFANGGVYRQRVPGSWEQFGTKHGLEHPATVITTDSLGRTWLGYANGLVARAIGDSIHLFSSADGPDVGGVLAISVHGDRVWVAGQFGVATLDETRRPAFVRLAIAGDPLYGVSGVVQAADGELWLNGADGITRIAAAEVRRALAEPEYQARYERLDHRDGIEPPAPQIRPLPSAVAGPDGRIWFTSAGGVSWIDPRHVRRNAVPPPVQVRVLSAGGRRYLPSNTLGDSIRIQPRTTQLSFAYTAYSFAVPERVRFKYRLDGLDTAWQDAGGRREAFYTNLRPGQYRFHIIASNDDGIWNDAGAELSFTLLPAWYQTVWFRGFSVLLIGAVGATVAGLWQRNRHLRSQAALKGRYEATLAERARIAQDLHDTLLQGFAGVTLQLKAAEVALPEQPDVAAETILRVQQLARASLREARERVWEMRESDVVVEDLPNALETIARERTAGMGMSISMEVAGQRRRLPRSVEDAALRIGREAIVNAVQHAEPRKIQIHVKFDPTVLRLEVRDDGRGFRADQGEEARRVGHFGLSGMLERAARIGGRCDVLSRPGEGTTVALELPLAEAESR